MSVGTCTCGEDAETFVAGRPFCAEHAFELVGPPLSELARDIDERREAGELEEDTPLLGVVECGRCEGWMWAAVGETCLGCGSEDLRVVRQV